MSKLEIAANTGGCLKLGLFPGVCHVLFVTAYDLIGDRLAEKHQNRATVKQSEKL